MILVVNDILERFSYLLALVLNQVCSLSIIRRGDRFQAKATAVNSHLYQLCVDGNFAYLDNSNIRLEHLQKGGHWGNIHLNDKGTNIFKQNLVDILSI